MARLRIFWGRKVAAGGGATVTVPAGALTLTGYAPTVLTPRTVSVPAGALTLTGFAPTVAVSSGTTVQVPAGNLTLTGFAPVVLTPRTVAVPAGTLTLTGFAPVVQTGATVSVPTGALTLTGFAPTVVTTANQLVQVPAGNLTLTGFAPTVIATGAVVEAVSPSGGWEIPAKRRRDPEPPTPEEVQAQREAMGIVPKRTKLKARSKPVEQTEPRPVSVPDLQGIDLAIWLEMLQDDIGRGIDRLPPRQIDYMRAAAVKAAQRLEEQDIAFVVGAALAMID